MKHVKDIMGVPIYSHKGKFFICVDHLGSFEHTELLGRLEGIDPEPKKDGNELVREIRKRYNIHKKNKFLNSSFYVYPEQIYNALGKHYNAGRITEEQIQLGFISLCSAVDTSMIQFFLNSGLTNHHALMDFISIVNNGIISHPKEGKGAKMLTGFIENGKVTPNQIEEAWFWMIQNKKHLSRSLTSIPGILPNFLNLDTGKLKVPNTTFSSNYSLEDLLENSNGCGQIGFEECKNKFDNLEN